VNPRLEILRVMIRYHDTAAICPKKPCQHCTDKDCRGQLSVMQEHYKASAVLRRYRRELLGKHRGRGMPRDLEETAERLEREYKAQIREGRE
jgi:hypothetical protein